MRQGKGKFSYANGDWYEGDWVEGKRTGWGKLYTKYKEECNEGEFLDGQLKIQ